MAFFETPVSLINLSWLVSFNNGVVTEWATVTRRGGGKVSSLKRINLVSWKFPFVNNALILGLFLTLFYLASYRLAGQIRIRTQLQFKNCSTSWYFLAVPKTGLQTYPILSYFIYFFIIFLALETFCSKTQLPHVKFTFTTAREQA